MPNILRANPALAMSDIFKYPDPKTTAFGGVATGSINAQDAATAAVTISAYGWILSATARDAIIGNIMEAVAVLEVISVKNKTSAATTRTMIKILTPCNPIN